MRGTGAARHSARRHHRFIPAHAGNRWAEPLGCGAAAVHPRACGEQWCPSDPSNLSAGSSPCMRGTAKISVVGVEHRRFIPAHAGNSECQGLCERSISVHPRTCGEQSVQGTAARSGVGSSPRMRGTAGTGSPPDHRQRFIPAHAGNSRPPTNLPKLPPVHPRACGEQSSLVAATSRAAGSSPRMRGTVPADVYVLLVERFIPAHAGNRARPHARPPGSAVHPRACGEQPRNVKVKRGICGSSPRMRGTVAGKHGAELRLRFIPAHAGNSR